MLGCTPGGRCWPDCSSHSGKQCWRQHAPASAIMLTRTHTHTYSKEYVHCHKLVGQVKCLCAGVQCLVQHDTPFLWYSAAPTTSQSRHSNNQTQQRYARSKVTTYTGWRFTMTPALLHSYQVRESLCCTSQTQSLLHAHTHHHHHHNFCPLPAQPPQPLRVHCAH